MKYLIVLFKNKERKKIIKKYKTFEKAKKFFDCSIQASNEVLFDKRVENGKFCDYEIGIVDTNPSDFENFFVKDELGRQVKIEIDDPSFKILSVSKYKVEDFIFDIKNNKKLNFISFIRKYLQKEGIKLVSKLNNKIVVQNDDSFNIFSLKSETESKRFLKILEDYMLGNKRLDCIIVSDDSTQQKKYLYELLNSKGIPKSFLYKKSTTFFTGK